MNTESEMLYKDWCDLACDLELSLAKKSLELGIDPKQVAEKMSQRLIQKLLYPQIKYLKYSLVTDYNSETSKKDYKEKYLDVYSRPADHVNYHE